MGFAWVEIGPDDSEFAEWLADAERGEAEAQAERERFPPPPGPGPSGAAP